MKKFIKILLLALVILSIPVNTQAASKGYVKKITASKKVVKFNNPESKSQKVVVKLTGTKKLKKHTLKIKNSNNEVCSIKLGKLKKHGTRSRVTLTITPKASGESTISLLTTGKSKKTLKLSIKCAVNRINTPQTETEEVDAIVDKASSISTSTIEGVEVETTETTTTYKSGKVVTTKKMVVPSQGNKVIYDDASGINTLDTFKKWCVSVAKTETTNLVTYDQFGDYTTKVATKVVKSYLNNGKVVVDITKTALDTVYYHAVNDVVAQDDSDMIVSKLAELAADDDSVVKTGGDSFTDFETIGHHEVPVETIKKWSQLANGVTITKVTKSVDGTIFYESTITDDGDDIDETVTLDETDALISSLDENPLVISSGTRTKKIFENGVYTIVETDFDRLSNGTVVDKTVRSYLSNENWDKVSVIE